MNLGNRYELGQIFSLHEEHVMLRDYRAWLQSELRTLGNATHHAYSLGQANMAKRAIERFDSELHGALPLTIDTAAANRILLALEMLEQRDTRLDPSLDELRSRLRDALVEKASGAPRGTPFTEA
jgi:hypothetical protein